MAIGVNEALEARYKFPNFPQLYFKIKTRKFTKAYRQFLRKNFPAQWPSNDTGQPLIGENFDTTKAHFQKENFAYVENFWDEAFYQKLIQQWPGDQYFEPIEFITKSYDKGFRWTAWDGPPEDAKLFPALVAGFEYLASPEFCKRVDAMMDDGKERECYQVLLTRAYWGSSIIPHMDSMDDNGGVNIVIFMNATGGRRSGNLGIWKDNEFKECIFEPENLKNSALFYDMSTCFYHGFEPMKFGSFRWSMNAAYKVKE